MWESDNCVTFDDRSPALHTSDQWQWHETITTFSLTSYTLSSGQATPPARRFLHTQKLSHALPTRVECLRCLRYPWARWWFIASAQSKQCKYLAPGRFLVTARMTECFLASRSKQWRETLFVQSLASLIRELIIWIRKRDPSTVAALSLSQP